MAKSRFRIIALRPITPQGRDDATIARVRSIQKKVFGEDWVYFYGGYKLTDIKYTRRSMFSQFGRQNSVS